MHRPRPDGRGTDAPHEQKANALYRFYGRNAFGGQVDAAHHLFAEGVDKDVSKKAWQTWLHGVYA